MKPRGTNSDAESELTTPKSTFGKPISQCGLSTKSLKPHEFTTPKKTSFQPSKSAFVPTNLTSRVSAKKLNSVNPKFTVPKNKSTIETMSILDFHHVSSC